ncbi:MAG: hypothetical protein MUF56_04650 [Solirubrobacteraceae bacterium]|jgi:hypothetical protein|nr:hypothetical protein [Solirubrobacteraceae bacterium]
MHPQSTGAVRFIAVLVLVLGALDVVWGISALANRDFFDEEELLFSSIQTWGWIHLATGIFYVLVGALLLQDRPAGYALGMFGAFLAILVNFLSIGAYPLWSVMLIALSFCVLFVLATRLGE